MDINININVDGEAKVDIKKPKLLNGIKRVDRKLKNGKETILKMPNAVESTDNRNILNLMGI